MKSFFRTIAGFILATVLIAPAVAGSVFLLVNPVGQVAPPTPPTLGAAGNTVTWTQGGSATAVDSSITVSGTITGATLTITSGFVLGDQLNFTNTATITGNFNAASGKLTLSGSDSAANYQTALRGITYSSTATTPTNSGTSAARTATWVGLNTTSGSAGIASTVNVVELPTIAGLSPGATYTQGGSPVALSPSVTVSDFSAANLTSASVSITSGFVSGDSLNFTNQGGITGSYNSGTGALSLSGSATLMIYQTALASITYSSTAGSIGTSRTITWAGTDSNSNSSVSGNTQLLSVSAGSTTQPNWVPSWASSGALSCNYQVNQCWTGSVVVSPTTYLSTTRASAESCELANSLTTAGANTPCINANGLGSWPAATNYVWPSDNVNNANWVLYAPTPGSGTAIISASYNTVTGPDGTANDASAITVTRSISSNLATLINNQITLPATGTYTTSCWLKADSSVYVGTQITQGIYDGINQASSQIATITLTSNWVRYPMTFTVAGGSGKQLLLGLNPNSSSSQIGTVVFDVWRCQMESGAAMTPSIQTTTAPITRPVDNILVTGLLSSYMAGTPGTYEIKTSGGVNPNTSTILDSNGNVFAGQAGNGAFTTGLPTPASTITTGNWASANTVREGWSSTGRTLGLNGSVIYKDSSVPSPAAPFHLGSTSGASNSFAGYIQMVTVAPTRVADSVIGIAAGGTNYYFSAAGSDSNNCTSTATSCSNNFATAATGGASGTGAKINTINYVPGDIINLNKGDTFTGCMLFNGNGGNVQSVAASGVTAQSYGSGGRPLVTSQGVQCPGEYAGPTVLTTAATVHLNDVNGFLWNGIDVQCDTSGLNSRGFSIENNSATGNSGITIENMNSTQGCFSQTGNFNTQGGVIFFSPDGNTSPSWSNAANNGGTGALMGNVQILNVVCSGPSPTTLIAANMCIAGGVGYFGPPQYDLALVQGILVYNLGGIAYSGNAAAPQISALDGTGIFTQGAGSSTPQIIQYVVGHDLGANVPGCGNNYGIWSEDTNNMVWQYIEMYHMGNSIYQFSCDMGGFDIDLGTTNLTAQYLYSHGNLGYGFNFFLGGHQAPNWGNNTLRYSIADANGQFVGNSMVLGGNGTTGTAFVYGNDFIDSGGGARTGNAPSTLSSCPGPGSVYANNIHVATQGGGVALLYFASIACSTLTFANNAYWCTNCSAGAGPSSQYFWRWNNQIMHGSAAWQASGVPNGDANSIFAVNPTFVGGIGGNTTCYSAITAPTSDPRSGCPSAYVLGGGSTYKGAGANLTTTQFGSINVGATDYYGVTIPSGGGSGYSIGASQ